MKKIAFLLCIISTCACGLQLTVRRQNAYFNLSGNVRIGTSGTNSAIMEASLSGNPVFFEAVISPLSLIKLGSKTNLAFARFSNDIIRMTVKADGKIGIETSAPAYTPDLSRNLDVVLLYLNSSFISVSQWTTPGASIHYNTTGVVNIAITATPSGYMLPEGKIISEEVGMNLRVYWPDHIFEKDCRLPFSYEFESYINANKFRLRYPSLRQCMKVVQMWKNSTTVLVKTIEELTLYLSFRSKSN